MLNCESLCQVGGLYWTQRQVGSTIGTRKRAERQREILSAEILTAFKPNSQPLEVSTPPLAYTEAIEEAEAILKQAAMVHEVGFRRLGLGLKLLGFQGLFLLQSSSLPTHLLTNDTLELLSRASP